MERDEYESRFEADDKRFLRRRKMELVLRMYSLLGVLMAILSAGYFVQTLLPFTLSEQQKTALLIIGVGLVLATMSRALLVFYREREAERMAERERLLTLLDAWSSFETVSKRVLDQQGEKFDQHSVRSIISKLQSDGKINDADVRIIEEALGARNAIVHGQRSLSPSFTKRVTDVLLSIVQKIAVP